MITIHVTQEDIDNGKKCSLDECPIAFALQRIAKAANINIQGKGIAVKELPANADKFITQFDYGTEPVQPFMFEIDEHKLIAVTHSKRKFTCK